MDRLLKTSTILANVAVLLGIPFFFYQAHNQDRLAAEERTLRYIEMYQSSYLAEARLNVQKPWRQLSLQRLIAYGANKGALDKIVREFLRSSEQIESSVLKVTDFFDSLWLCVDSSLCSSSTAREYFGVYAYRFYCIYGGYIDFLRLEQDLSGLGAGLENLGAPRNLCFGS